MKKNFNKGFTLIELLVVIAIIGILASVVLASLNSARNKGADAAVKANLANARAQAEIFYDSNSSSYDGGSAATDVCNTAGSVGTPAVKGVYPNLLAAATAAGVATASISVDGSSATTATTAKCNSTSAGWAIEVPLKAGGFYCVDSTGVSQTNASAGLGATAGDIAC